MNHREHCIIQGSEIQLELRQTGAKKSELLVGHAAVFDTLSEPIFGFREVVRPGAFTKSLEEGDQRAFWSHDPAQVLGRVSAGTLKLEEDDIGLRVEITPPDTQVGRDAIESVRRGDVTQMSFGFEAVRDVWKSDEKLGELRELLELRLWEVSPVAIPAYPDTEIGLREKLHAVEIRRAASGLTPVDPVLYRSLLSESPDLGTSGEGDSEQVEAAMAQKRRRLEELEQRH